jgi:hypothetical protein
MEETMIKFLFAGVVALIASGAAFAQSSQGQAGAQAGVNGNASTAPDSAMKNDGMRGGSAGTTTGTGSSSNNGSSTSMPKAQDSPSGRASEGQTAPK